MPRSRITQSRITQSPPRVAPGSPSLSAATWLRIASDPRAARLVRPIWSRLAELELAGHDPGLLDALRYTLVRHQPGRWGRCRACQWRMWPVRLWRRRWPCS
ncbi:MAG: hypothetical protein ACRDS0_26460, partial [Pseudonocardiaceae bacterium]